MCSLCSDLGVERQMGRQELNPAALISTLPVRISDRSQPPAKYHSLPPTQTRTYTPDNLTTNPLPSPSNHLFLTSMCLAATVPSTSRGHTAVSPHCTAACPANGVLLKGSLHSYICALSIIDENHVCVHIRPPEGCRLLRGDFSCL